MMTDYRSSIDAALKVQAKHIKMFVISVGQDAAKAHLQDGQHRSQSRARCQSGATVYYPEDPAALATTLSTLIGKELTCDVELQGKGVKPGKLRRRDAARKLSLRRSRVERNTASLDVSSSPRSP